MSENNNITRVNYRYYVALEYATQTVIETCNS